MSHFAKQVFIIAARCILRRLRTDIIPPGLNDIQQLRRLVGFDGNQPARCGDSTHSTVPVRRTTRQNLQQARYAEGVLAGKSDQSAGGVKDVDLLAEFFP